MPDELSLLTSACGRRRCHAVRQRTSNDREESESMMIKRALTTTAIAVVSFASLVVALPTSATAATAKVAASSGDYPCKVRKSSTSVAVSCQGPFWGAHYYYVTGICRSPEYSLRGKTQSSTFTGDYGPWSGITCPTGTTLTSYEIYD